ncbi:type 3 dihydrofolate reductase [Shewanella sp. SR43-4]|jgi:dihydrofolate reductase|uniref:Dihydrofolate reductase n=1 Tax=Shewanella vesiculosa TaxID=518738 RepID=A0ABV0FPJ8_9GAMM|nr:MULTISPECIES: type 3 dihydrofolate reductase [Shewanella]MBB1319263.1 type 3 dihydrofolate reductase [Shewanella sp. SR43-4]MBB1321181.1 type 3 dihydrofolate reductase [Shewanella sp. SR43-8]MBB1389893.1 type 3 dihydrofolate reductase [Shewanella sp. SG44-6]MBB1474103.1 type 3 dihydrofolate reductase [Shewanella sp. SG41-3]RPA38790.1 type 3 dihydrofolate reductase [Shewanella vesiculosa]|tara:strand:- start:7001 stop:7483 length:483 start_codon:yes stop_codon:yes gene_type:complete
MRIAMIAAMANNRVIGKDNKMPWHLPEDLRHFKAMTLSKPVVMGRKTFESIGRPLPGRHNIVISRNSQLSIDGVTCVQSFDDAVAAAGDCDEIVVIGGGQLYQQLLPKADILYLTLIDLDVDGDTLFPDWDDGSWQLQNSVNATNDKGLQYSFNTLHKKC